MTLSNILTFLLLLLPVSPNRGPALHIMHEERYDIHGKWIKRSRVSPDTLLPVRIGLVQNNLNKGPEYLLNVSDPSSPNYGKHWTPEQVIEAFKPSETSIGTVYNWLLDSGIESSSITHLDNKAWFAFYATAEQIEALVSTEYHGYDELHTRDLAPACDRYYTPRHVQQHVDYITPGIRPVARMRRSLQQSLRKRQKHYDVKPVEKRSPSGKMPPHPHRSWDTCDITITPACIAALYEIAPARVANPGNSMGIWESELGWWDQRDLDLFYAKFTPWIPKGTHPSSNLIDRAKARAPNVTEASFEAMLDLEMA